MTSSIFCPLEASYPAQPTLIRRDEHTNINIMKGVIRSSLPHGSLTQSFMSESKALVCSALVATLSTSWTGRALLLSLPLFSQIERPWKPITFERVHV